MSKKNQALNEYEQFQQREEYWEKLFARMRENQKEENIAARNFSF